MNKLAYTLLLVIALILYLFPEIDLYISSLFFDKEAGTFYLSNEPILRVIYKSVNVLAPILVLAMILGFVYQYIRKTEFTYFNKRAIIYMFLVFFIGAGVIVNLIFKDNFGRARPHQVTYFGGDKQFTPPAVMADQCEKNCSFTCGHCSFAIGLIALYLLFRRYWILSLVVVYGLLISFTRVAQGGHFFSDVFFSFLVMFLSARILYYFIYKK